MASFESKLSIKPTFSKSSLIEECKSFLLLFAFFFNFRIVWKKLNSSSFGYHTTQLSYSMCPSNANVYLFDNILTEVGLPQ